MKKIIMIFLCLILCFCAFSLSDEDVKFLKSLDSFSGSSLSGLYSQTKSAKGSSRALTTTGSVLISPEFGIAWLAEKPYASKMIVAKDHLTQQIRNNKPTLLDVSGNEIYLQIATALECVFFGDFNTMLELFVADFKRSGESWTLNLSPKEKSLTSFISSIEIKGEKSLNSLCLYEATGDKIEYKFSDLVSRELTVEEKAIYSL